MCTPGYVFLALLLEDCNISTIFGGNVRKMRCLSFTIITFGFLFTLSTGITPFLFGGGYTYVNHSVSCQPSNGKDENKEDHIAENLYHFFGSVQIYWVVTLTSVVFLCKNINRNGITVLGKPSTSSLLIFFYLLCFLPESVSETLSCLRIFNIILVPEFAEDNEIYEMYAHVVMAVILPIVSSAANCLVHFFYIIRFPTMVQYEVTPDD